MCECRSVECEYSGMYHIFPARRHLVVLFPILDHRLLAKFTVVDFPDATSSIHRY